jgi:N-acetylmuramoyl-L-alanine amidase
MKLLKKTGFMITGVIAAIAFSVSTAFAADYKVVTNDSLYKISNLFQTSVNTLMSDNKLNSSVIYPGQILTVPAQVYTVKSGDTLYLIAKRYGITVDSLRMANHKWDDLLLPDQQLLLPGINNGSSTTTGSSTTGGNTTGSSTSSSNTSQKTVINVTDNEVNLLARLITAETTGQPYDAMVAVGAVVVNRVQSPDWPNSVSSVINQVINGYYQFTPVKNGYIKNAPSDIAVKAAWAALYGSDPSKDAIFYFDNSSTNQWMWSRPITARIGAMVFAK